MSIMDMFRTIAGQGAQPAAQPAAPTPGQIPDGAAGHLQQQTTTTAANGHVPAATADIAAKSPLDAFGDIWKNPETPLPGDAGQPYFTIDQAKLVELAQQQNFAPAITKEHLSAIQAGGDTAIAALGQIINAASQNSYAQSAIAATKIVEAALSKAEGRFDARLPIALKSLNASSGLKEANPVLAHPAAQPIVNAIQQQMLLKNPNASHAELQKMAQDYLTAFAAELQPKPAVQDAGTDWSSFLTGN